jgi:hypothetical protein
VLDVRHTPNTEEMDKGDGRVHRIKEWMRGQESVWTTPRVQ